MKNLILILLWLSPVLAGGQIKSRMFEVDEDYLDRHDIVFKSPFYEGFEGLPLGNGDLGGLIWNNNYGIEIQVNKNDLFDQSGEESLATLRGGARLSIDFGNPCFEWLYLEDFDGRLSLKDAQVSMTSATPFMKTNVKTWLSANSNVWIVEVEATGQEDQKTRTIVQLERYGSRAFPGWYGGYSANTSIGLGNTRSSIQNQFIVLEDSFKELDFSVVCCLIGTDYDNSIISNNRLAMETQAEYHHKFKILLSVVTSNESSHPTETAIELIKSTINKGIEEERRESLDWWSDFWQRSFVNLGEDYIENLYYFRRYLMAASSRGKFPVVFNGGLWTWNHDVRNWVTPHHWNTQQQYWGLCAQNDCDLLLPYVDTYFALMPQAEEHARLRGAENSILWSEPHDFFGSMTFWNRGDMINNFTPASQIAGFFWEYYQYTENLDFLADKAYPFLKKAAEFYVQKLQWDKEKQEFFIYPSQPYESPRSSDLKNSVTDRNMILSTMSACVEAAKILDRDKSKIKEWEHIMAHLWPIPIVEEPGKGEVMHIAYYPGDSIYPGLETAGDWMNHFSANTSVVFPSNLIGLNQKESREFKAAQNIIKNHAPYRNAISPDPIVAARLGMGDAVLDRFTNSIRRLQHFPQGFFYNIDHWYNLSLYMDSLNQPDVTAQRDYVYDLRAHYPKGHPARPFIQCGLEPLSIIGAAVNEMLLHSHEGIIRVFPAIPEGWSPSFKLRARGGFLVSSQMKENRSVTGIEVESLKGKTCRIESPWGQSSITISAVGDENYKVFKPGKDNIIEFQTQSGISYMLQPVRENFEQVIFKGEKNNAPKDFLEAILGKSRNFQ